MHNKIKNILQGITSYTHRLYPNHYFSYNYIDIEDIKKVILLFDNIQLKKRESCVLYIYTVYYFRDKIENYIYIYKKYGKKLRHMVFKNYINTTKSYKVLLVEERCDIRRERRGVESFLMGNSIFIFTSRPSIFTRVGIGGWTGRVFRGIPGFSAGL